MTQTLSITLASVFASALAVAITLVVTGQTGMAQELNPLVRRGSAGLMLAVLARLLAIAIAQVLASHDPRFGPVVYLVCFANMLDAGNNLLALYSL